jgi:hypothetical protein
VDELGGAILATVETRNKYAGQGKEGLTNIFDTTLAALLIERDRRIGGEQ